MSVFTETIEFPSQGKADEIVFLLDHQRQDGSFCDVQLKLGPNKVVHAHKAVLASCSSYFESMFTSQFLEASSEVIDLSHATENSEVLENVINSCYNRKFEICTTNVGETLHLAAMFLMEDLKSICASVLFEMVNVGNAAEIFLMSVNYDLKGLLIAVEPIYGSRFHDSIMFQEELLEYTPIQLDQCLSKANLCDISRKGDFLNMLLRWFSITEKDDRADYLVLMLNKLPFKITSSIYKENENEIAGILDHIFDANSDISTENAEKLKAALDSLKPDGYQPLSTLSNIDEELSDPVKQRTAFDYKPMTLGCQTEEEGYTSDEERVYERHQERVAKSQHDREMAKKWPPSKKCTEPPEYHPDRPKKIVREAPWPVHESRHFRLKTETELLEESRLVDMVVVIAPGVDYFEKQANEDGTWSLDVCGYVPGMKAWYKLGTCNVDITETFGSLFRKTARDTFRTKFLSHYTRRDFTGLVSSMHRDMFELLQERGNKDRDPMMHAMMRGQHLSKLPPLSNKKWNVTYLKHKLYFFHQDFCENVLIYDLFDHSWTPTRFDAVESSNGVPITVEGIELIVMGQILYAVVQIVIYEVQRRDLHYDDTENDPFQYARVLHKIYRYNEESKSWSHYFTTKEHHARIPLDKPAAVQRPGQGRRSYQDYQDIPVVRQAGTFRTVLFSEDEEKMNIILMVKMFNEDPECYSISHLSMVYLDLRKENDHVKIPDNQRYIRQPNPLYDNDLFIFINDDLDFTSRFDVADPDEWNRFRGLRITKPEKESKLLKAEQSHPLQPMIQASNGHRMWILEGNSDCTSSMSEYTINVCYSTKEVRKNQSRHPPPPFRGFSMACTGKLDKTLIKSLQPPTKYLQP